MVRKRLSELRKIMGKTGIDGYIITTSDYHGSEFVGDYFKEREYMSGFTGSAGTLVVLKDKAALWTDGRYFIQAEEQLRGSSIELMRSGEKGVCDISTFLLNNLKYGETIGFDGRCVSSVFAENLCKWAADKGINIESNINLVEEIWTDRPKLSDRPVWELGNEYTGMEVMEKLSLVRQKIKASGGEVLVLSSLDDIAWLLNLRGDDIKYNPVFLSYMIIYENKSYLYANKNIFSDKIVIKLADAGVEIRPYNDIYDSLAKIEENKIVLDKSKVNYAILKGIDSSKTIISRINPTTELKAVKTETEADNMARAHIKDGVAVTRFMYWLKSNVGKETITEISGAEKLESLRAEQDGYIGPSFEPIMAYGEHGAIVHYAPSQATNTELKAESFLLCDTGGHYYEGTTDITRTFALGELTEEQKMMYTLVLAGNLKLAAAKFPYGIRGINLDVLAREPLWKKGFDFKHGTGHGVGYLLNVHEGPNNISPYIMADKIKEGVLEAGMITSDEPGIYIKGKYGIRLENLLLCKEEKITEYGRFMGFETITVVPFDLDAVDISFMTDEEIFLLNSYHRKVYKKISPYLSGEELLWLQKATREVKRY